MSIQQIDGRPIVDAKHPLKLTVTKRDCTNSDPKRPESCAAAQALRREHHIAECRVHLGRIYIRQNKGNWQRYETPANLRTEIISFDRGGSFQVGEYVLRPIRPSHLKARGKRHGSAKGQNKLKHKSRRSPTIVKDVRGGPAI